MAERLPTRELSGGKASVDSSTRLVANLVVEYAVDFLFDPFSSVALGLMVCSEGSGFLSCSAPVTDCVGSRAALSKLRGNVFRRIHLSTLVYVLLNSRFFEIEGTGVGEIEGSILRFGCE